MTDSPWFVPGHDLDDRDHAERAYMASVEAQAEASAEADDELVIVPFVTGTWRYRDSAGRQAPMITRRLWDDLAVTPRPALPWPAALYFRAIDRMLALDPGMDTRHRDTRGLARYVLAELREEDATIDRWADDGGAADVHAV